MGIRHQAIARIGRCIYCGAPPTGREHAIPRGQRDERSHRERVDLLDHGHVSELGYMVDEPVRWADRGSIGPYVWPERFGTGA
jgi:hypothetical protein